MGNSVRGKLSTADVQLLVVHLPITGNALNDTICTTCREYVVPYRILVLCI
jgi:hypothetical protein